MLDVLAAISSVDPPSFVAWAVLLFAAGMYPVGIMLGGSCSPCCAPSTPCTACTEGELPDTLTVTFDGLADQTPGPDLITLGFSACYGGGAAARVTAPGGDPLTDKGPISAVSLTSGGGGYAKLGRVAPTLTVSGGSGTGATFTPTLTSTNDACGVQSWSLASVAVTGGEGYLDGEALTITFAEGDTEAGAATAVVNTTASEPTVTASVGGGSGATLTVTLEESGGWIVSAVTVLDGGTGYTDGDSVTFTPDGDTAAVLDAQAFIVVGRTEPTVTASATGGTGADLAVTLSQETDEFGSTFWTVASVAVIDGGTGYTDGDPVTFTVTDGTSEFSASGYIVVTDGEITAVDVPYYPYYPYDSGYYYKSTGVIESVIVTGGGSYYNETGTPSSITVTSGGQYYREDASEPPYVADVTVTITQGLPSAGAGAEITATVEDDTSSPNFGKITALTIANGGDDYLAWEWRNTKCCGHFYNGQSFVLQRNPFPSIATEHCTYGHAHCGADNVSGMLGRVMLYYHGPTEPPVLQLITEYFPEEGIQRSSSTCDAIATASGNVTNCGDWSGITFSIRGGTATVTQGGAYDPLFRNPAGGIRSGGASCNVCCQGNEVPPQEITVSVSGSGDGSSFDRWPDQQGLGGFDGDFVLSRNASFSGLAWYFDPPPVAVPGLQTNWDRPPLSVVIEPCSSPTSASFEDRFEKDAYGCDFCNQKCRVVFYYAGFDQRFCKGSDPNHCGVCVDTPKCSPVGASFTRCSLQLSPAGSTQYLGFPSQVNPDPLPIPGTPVDMHDCTDYGEPPEWTKYPVGYEVDPETGISTGVMRYAYAWPQSRGARCTMQVTISE